MIYFIQSEDGGPIKIGRSRDPRKRLAALQTSHPDDLRLLAVMDGDEAEEEALHKAFPPTRGEWCNPTAELLEYIDRYAIPVAASRQEVRLKKLEDEFQKVKSLVAQGKGANQINRLLPGSRDRKLQLVRRAKAELAAEAKSQ
jgi:hypothetical protein